MFSPALTDGALGDMFYLFSGDNPGLVLDIIEGKKKKKESFALFFLQFSWGYCLLTQNLSLISDVTKLNSMVLAANRTGIILLGGGLAKHHVCNANSWVRIQIVQLSPSTLLL